MLANVHFFECPGKVDYNSIQEYTAAMVYAKRNSIETLRTIANVMASIGTEESSKKAIEALRLMMEELDPEIKHERNKSLRKMAESFKEFEGKPLFIRAKDHPSDKGIRRRNPKDNREMKLTRRPKPDASNNPD